MRVWIAALVSSGFLAFAQAGTAEPPGDDSYASIELARELDHLCPTFTYFEQRYLEFAASERYPYSQEKQAVDAASDAQRPLVQAEWRAKRREQAKKIGCEWDGALAMSKGGEQAYRDLAASLLIAQHFRMGAQANPAVAQMKATLGRLTEELTEEERELVAFGIGRIVRKYDASAPNVEASAQVLAMERLTGQGSEAELHRQARMFTTLRFQAAAWGASYEPRLLLFDQPDGPPRQMIEMKHTDDGTRLFVVAGPASISIARRAGGATGAYVVTVREPSGALLVGLYGRNTKDLKDLPLRAVLLETGAPREGARVTGPECMFELCFRYPANVMQDLTAMSSTERYVSLITELSSNETGERQAINRDQVVLAAGQVASPPTQR